MVVDINAADAASAFAVLLHPHPDYGGDRFHPFINTLFLRLPAASVSAIRFDFSTAATAEARDEVIAAINVGTERWPQLSVIIAGYSFGAGIAATVDDPRIAGWYLLAPPSVMLAHSAIGDDPRPKAVLVPEHDQFSTPETVEQLIGGWRSTTMDTLAGTDHFLGAVEPVVDHALSWIGSLLSP
jgi:uncharacterized protein